MKIVHVLIVAIALLSISGCGESGSEPRQTPIPPYPGVPESVVGMQAKNPSVSFVTNDSEIQVLDWYKTAMVENGWELSGFTEPAGIASFSNESGCPKYRVDVVAGREANQTKVTINLFRLECG